MIYRRGMSQGEPVSQNGSLADAMNVLRLLAFGAGGILLLSVLRRAR